MSGYLVKNKYTYEKVRQTDYTYHADNWAMSQNLVEGRFIYEAAEPICTLALTPNAAPVEVPLTPGQGARFAEVSGFMIAQKAGEGLLCRVTLWGAEGESFCSVAYLKETARLFSTVKMDFTPVRMTLETRAYHPQWEVPEMEVSLTYGYVLNTLGEVGGQSHFYTVESRGADGDGVGNAALSDWGGALSLTLDGVTTLTSPVFPDSSDTVYNMKMPRRNTVFMVLTNHSTAKVATLTFATTTHPWGKNAALGVALAQDDRPHAYYFNLSAFPDFCDGRLTQFTLTAEGEGEIIIHRYTFEQEKPIREVGCEVISLVADPVAETITFRGNLLGTEALSAYAGGKLKLYTTTMADELDTPAGKRFVGEAAMPAGGVGEFTIDGIPLRDDRTTLLPYQFAVFAEAEGREPLWLCDRFYIENYEDFDKTPYPFDLPAYTVSVTDFGALGDAVHDDTEAIQAAVDHVADAGGGTVILPGSSDFYGRRYIVTSILLRSCVELHFEKGAILWQSQLKDDYLYEVAYGHDGVIPGINWTHNLHVANLPLLQAANIHHFKVTGAGTIRMMDTGSEEGVGMPGYATGCPDRIHCIPIGFFHVEHCECRDFEIIRSNNYHTSYSHSKYIYIANVRLHEVKCVSGDGFGVGGCQHVLVNRCFFQSNDDGIVMSCHYTDPRGILWWTNMKDEDNSCRDITTVHSYINSGGGKALAFITWGTSDPIQEREEISEIEAHDNFLTSVNPVGTWPDNPYAGKQPFDNTETDDYSPVKNVRIWGNRYIGNCTLGPIACTNVVTDCGVHSTNAFRNGDFTLGGLANWTLFKNTDPACIDTVIYADKEKGRICHFEAGEVAAAQGLHLLAGKHTVSAELFTGKEGATLYAARIGDGKVLAEQTFICPRPTTVTLTFELDAALGEEEDVFIGFRSVGEDPEGFAVFDGCVLTSVVDEEGLMNRRREAFMAKLTADFAPSGTINAFFENGKMLIGMAAEETTNFLPARGKKGIFAIEGAVRAEHYDYIRQAAGFGYRFSVRSSERSSERNSERDGELSYRELRFNVCRQTLTLIDVNNGVETELYHRDHFFFTSNDFHIFRIETEDKCVSVWIDGSQYAVIPCPLIKGEAAFFLTDARVSIYQLKTE